MGTEDRATKHDRPDVTGAIADVTKGRPFAAGSVEDAKGGSVLQSRGCAQLFGDPVGARE